MTRPQLQGVHIHCITSPSEYTPAEIEMAVHIMALLNRGLFVLTAQPEGR